MTDTSTMTLTEFLLARIAEDEERAQRYTLKFGVAYGTDERTVDTDYYWVTYGGGRREYVTQAEFRERFMDPSEPDARVLAECEAKRRIMEEHPQEVRRPVVDIYDDWCGTCRDPWPCSTLRILATVYADHRDYREEWRA